MAPLCTVRDMLDSKDGTVTWGPLMATVSKAPTTVKSSPGNYGDWVRATLSLQSEGSTIELVWTDPTEPYLSNPKSLEGQAVTVEQGVKIEEYKGVKRLKAKAGQVTVHGSHPAQIVAPAPTSQATGASQTPPPQAPAHVPVAQLTDRALLEAYAAWAPKLWAILDPGMQATGETAQAVAACLNTMTIAAGQGKLAVTLYAEVEGGE